MYPLLTCGPSYWKLNYIAPVDVVVGSEIEVPEILRGLFGKVLATSHERLRVLMASLFGFGRNMLRF